MNKKITIAIDAMGGDENAPKKYSRFKYFFKKNLNKNDFLINLFGNENK